ncbi:hypothetical protein RFI_05860 [Reticulomyxa filosa]|uniref:Uncharacterized protein n=1 Tax=Reticulomyxa filosa TaxID=46433 RepID=X6NY62_RETFI|nr:hypothetical protein RFI_05860 [Reticulomyxa filosa]|eukprot:ETO31260.1 hypothetical protein RFI_05860 [Reticulomyxa filosa]
MNKPQSASCPKLDQHLIENSEEDEEQESSNVENDATRRCKKMRENNDMVSSSYLIPLYSTNVNIFSLCISREDLTHGRVNVMSRLKMMTIQGIFSIVLCTAALFILVVSLSIHYFHSGFGNNVWKRDGVDDLGKDNNMNGGLVDIPNYPSNSGNSNGVDTINDTNINHYYTSSKNYFNVDVVALDWDFVLPTEMFSWKKNNSYAIVYYNISTHVQLCNGLISISSFHGNILEKKLAVDVVMVISPNIKPSLHTQHTLQLLGVYYPIYVHVYAHVFCCCFLLLLLLLVAYEQILCVYAYTILMKQNDNDNATVSRQILYHLLHELKYTYLVFLDSHTFLFGANIVPLFSLKDKKTEPLHKQPQQHLYHGQWYVSLSTNHPKSLQTGHTNRVGNNVCISSYLFILSVTTFDMSANTLAFIDSSLANFNIVSFKKNLICEAKNSHHRYHNDSTHSNHFHTWKDTLSLRYIPSDTIVNLEEYIKTEKKDNAHPHSHHSSLPFADKQTLHTFGVNWKIDESYVDSKKLTYGKLYESWLDEISVLVKMCMK